MRIILLGLLTTLLVSCGGKTSKIYGIWKRDGEASIKHLLENNQLSDQQKKFWESFYGADMVITYNDDGTGQVVIGAHEFPDMNGKTIKIDQTVSDFTFEVIGETDFQVAARISTENDVMNGYPFYILAFDGRDAFRSGADQRISTLNICESFKRANQNKSEQGAAPNP
jgi:hypothetical protein